MASFPQGALHSPTRRLNGHFSPSFQASTRPAVEPTSDAPAASRRSSATGGLLFVSPSKLVTCNALTKLLEVRWSSRNLVRQRVPRRRNGHWTCGCRKLSRIHIQETTVLRPFCARKNYIQFASFKKPSRPPCPVDQPPDSGRLNSPVALQQHLPHCSRPTITGYMYTSTQGFLVFSGSLLHLIWWLVLSLSSSKRSSSILNDARARVAEVWYSWHWHPWAWVHGDWHSWEWRSWTWGPEAGSLRDWSQ